MPTAKQIDAWLGDFQRVRFRPVRWRPGEDVYAEVREAAAREDQIEAEPSLWAQVWHGLIEQWSEMLGHAPADPGMRVDLYTRSRFRVRRTVLVRANHERVAFVGRRHPPYVAWSDIVRVVDLDNEVVWHLANGRLLRLPRDPRLSPLHLVARRVSAARRRHEEALLDRMARGLSRPGGADSARRGLSRSTGDVS